MADFAQMIYGTAQNIAQDQGKGLAESVNSGAQIGLKIKEQDQNALSQAASIALKKEELLAKQSQLKQKDKELAQAKLGKLFDYVKEAKNYDTASARNGYLKSALGYRNALGLDPNAIPDDRIMALGMDENMGRFAALDLEVQSGRMTQDQVLKITMDPQALAKVIPLPAEITKTPDFGKTEQEFLKMQSQERQAAYKSGMTVEQIKNQKAHLDNQDTISALKAQQEALKLRLDTAKQEEEMRQNQFENARKDKELALKEQLAAADRASREKIAGMKAKKPGGSAGSKELEKKIASKYADWSAGGGRSGIESSLVKLNEVANKLETGKISTGGMTTFIPGLNSDTVQSAINPEMVNTKIEAQSALNSVLRQTLGAQFTAQEGDRVMRQIWDDKQTPQANAKKIRMKISELRSNALSAEREFSKFGFMEGPSVVQKNAGGPQETVNFNGRSFTKDKLKQFLKDHPRDPQAPMIRNLLGGK